MLVSNELLAIEELCPLGRMFSSLPMPSQLALGDRDVLELSLSKSVTGVAGAFLSFLTLSLDSVMTMVKSLTVTLWYVAEPRSTFLRRGILKSKVDQNKVDYRLTRPISAYTLTNLSAKIS